MELSNGKKKKKKKKAYCFFKYESALEKQNQKLKKTE